MPIIITDVIQGTPEWAALRCGIPTSSNFSKLITPKTMELSKSSTPYMHTLLAERILGEPTVEFTSHWQDRGSEMEAEAVNFYQFTRDAETEKVGFILNDDRTIGASPDRLVADDGLLEIKCPSPGVHISYLLNRTVDAEYYPQIMGQLWISGRQWVDIMSYHPEMPSALIRVERDDKYIQKLSSVVTAFAGALEEQFRLMAELGWVKPKQAPKPSPARAMSIVDAMKASLIEIEASRRG